MWALCACSAVVRGKVRIAAGSVASRGLLSEGWMC